MKNGGPMRLWIAVFVAGILSTRAHGEHKTKRAITDDSWHDDVEGGRGRISIQEREKTRHDDASEDEIFPNGNKDGGTESEHDVSSQQDDNGDEKYDHSSSYGEEQDYHSEKEWLTEDLSSDDYYSDDTTEDDDNGRERHDEDYADNERTDDKRKNGFHGFKQWKLEDSIPGVPGEDYPTYKELPKTGFGCEQQIYPGLYGDTGAQCQVFHICQEDGRQDSFLCPVGTIFNQQYFVCDWWFNFDCSATPNYFELNALLYQTPDKTETGRGSNAHNHGNDKRSFREDIKRKMSTARRLQGRKKGGWGMIDDVRNIPDRPPEQSGYNDDEDYDIQMGTTSSVEEGKKPEKWGHSLMDNSDYYKRKGNHQKKLRNRINQHNEKNGDGGLARRKTPFRNPNDDSYDRMIEKKVAIHQDLPWMLTTMNSRKLNDEKSVTSPAIMDVKAMFSTSVLDYVLNTMSNILNGQINETEGTWTTIGFTAETDRYPKTEIIVRNSTEEGWINGERFNSTLPNNLNITGTIGKGGNSEMELDSPVFQLSSPDEKHSPSSVTSNSLLQSTESAEKEVQRSTDGEVQRSTYRTENEVQRSTDGEVQRHTYRTENEVQRSTDGEVQRHTYRTENEVQRSTDGEVQRNTYRTENEVQRSTKSKEIEVQGSTEGRENEVQRIAERREDEVQRTTESRENKIQRTTESRENEVSTASETESTKQEWTTSTEASFKIATKRMEDIKIREESTENSKLSTLAFDDEDIRSTEEDGNEKIELTSLAFDEEDMKDLEGNNDKEKSIMLILYNLSRTIMPEEDIPGTTEVYKSTEDIGLTVTNDSNMKTASSYLVDKMMTDFLSMSSTESSRELPVTGTSGKTWTGIRSFERERKNGRKNSERSKVEWRRWSVFSYDSKPKTKYNIPYHNRFRNTPKLQHGGRYHRGKLSRGSQKRKVGRILPRNNGFGRRVGWNMYYGNRRKSNFHQSGGSGEVPSIPSDSQEMRMSPEYDFHMEVENIQEERKIPENMRNTNTDTTLNSGWNANVDNSRQGRRNRLKDNGKNRAINRGSMDIFRQTEAASAEDGDDGRLINDDNSEERRDAMTPPVLDEEQVQNERNNEEEERNRMEALVSNYSKEEQEAMITESIRERQVNKRCKSICIKLHQSPDRRATSIPDQIGKDKGKERKFNVKGLEFFEPTEETKTETENSTFSEEKLRISNGGEDLPHILCEDEEVDTDESSIQGRGKIESGADISKAGSKRKKRCKQIRTDDTVTPQSSTSAVNKKNPVIWTMVRMRTDGQEDEDDQSNQGKHWPEMQTQKQNETDKDDKNNQTFWGFMNGKRTETKDATLVSGATSRDNRRGEGGLSQNNRNPSALDEDRSSKREWSLGANDKRDQWQKQESTFDDEAQIGWHPSETNSGDAKQTAWGGGSSTDSKQTESANTGRMDTKNKDWIISDSKKNKEAWAILNTKQAKEKTWVSDSKDETRGMWFEEQPMPQERTSKSDVKDSKQDDWFSADTKGSNQRWITTIMKDDKERWLPSVAKGNEYSRESSDSDENKKKWPSFAAEDNKYMWSTSRSKDNKRTWAISDSKETKQSSPFPGVKDVQKWPSGIREKQKGSSSDSTDKERWSLSPISSRSLSGSADDEQKWSPSGSIGNEQRWSLSVSMDDKRKWTSLSSVDNKRGWSAPRSTDNKQEWPFPSSSDNKRTWSTSPSKNNNPRGYSDSIESKGILASSSSNEERQLWLSSNPQQDKVEWPSKANTGEELPPLDGKVPAKDDWRFSGAMQVGQSEWRSLGMPSEVVWSESHADKKKQNSWGPPDSADDRKSSWDAAVKKDDASTHSWADASSSDKKKQGSWRTLDRTDNTKPSWDSAVKKDDPPPSSWSSTSGSDEKKQTSWGTPDSSHDRKPAWDPAVKKDASASSWSDISDSDKKKQGSWGTPDRIDNKKLSWDSTIKNDNAPSGSWPEATSSDKRKQSSWEPPEDTENKKPSWDSAVKKDDAPTGPWTDASSSNKKKQSSWEPPDSRDSRKPTWDPSTKKDASTGSWSDTSSSDKKKQSSWEPPESRESRKPKWDPPVNKDDVPTGSWSDTSSSDKKKQSSWGPPDTIDDKKTSWDSAPKTDNVPTESWFSVSSSDRKKQSSWGPPVSSDNKKPSWDSAVKKDDVPDRSWADPSSSNKKKQSSWGPPDNRDSRKPTWDPPVNKDDIPTGSWSGTSSSDKEGEKKWMNFDENSSKQQWSIQIGSNGKPQNGWIPITVRPRKPDDWNASSKKDNRGSERGMERGKPSNQPSSWNTPARWAKSRDDQDESDIWSAATSISTNSTKSNMEWMPTKASDSGKRWPSDIMPINSGDKEWRKGRSEDKDWAKESGKSHTKNEWSIPFDTAPKLASGWVPIINVNATIKRGTGGPRMPQGSWDRQDDKSKTNDWGSTSSDKWRSTTVSPKQRGTDQHKVWKSPVMPETEPQTSWDFKKPDAKVDDSWMPPDMINTKKQKDWSSVTDKDDDKSAPDEKNQRKWNTDRSSDTKSDIWSADSSRRSRYNQWNQGTSNADQTKPSQSYGDASNAFSTLQIASGDTVSLKVVSFANIRDQLGEDRDFKNDDNWKRQSAVSYSKDLSPINLWSGGRAGLESGRWERTKDDKDTSKTKWGAADDESDGRDQKTWNSTKRSDDKTKQVWGVASDIDTKNETWKVISDKYPNQNQGWSEQGSVGTSNKDQNKNSWDFSQDTQGGKGWSAFTSSDGRQQLGFGGIDATTAGTHRNWGNVDSNAAKQGSVGWSFSGSSGSGSGRPPAWITDDSTKSGQKVWSKNDDHDTKDWHSDSRNKEAAGRKGMGGDSKKAGWHSDTVNSNKQNRWNDSSSDDADRSGGWISPSGRTDLKQESWPKSGDGDFGVDGGSDKKSSWISVSREDEPGDWSDSGYGSNDRQGKWNPKGSSDAKQEDWSTSRQQNDGSWSSLISDSKKQKPWIMSPDFDSGRRGDWRTSAGKKPASQWSGGSKDSVGFDQPGNKSSGIPRDNTTQKPREIKPVVGRGNGRPKPSSGLLHIIDGRITDGS